MIIVIIDGNAAAFDGTSILAAYRLPDRKEQDVRMSLGNRGQQGVRLRHPGLNHIAADPGRGGPAKVQGRCDVVRNIVTRFGN